MLVGHAAVGLAAKRLAPRVSLGTLQLAASLPDVLVSAFQISGIEHVRITPGITAYIWLDAYDVPISHSLVMDIIWAALFAVLYFRRRRDSRGAWVIFSLVVSHWVLDFVSHGPEMPVVPGLDWRVGLGLWNSLPATFAVEGALWLACVIVYLRATTPKTALGTYAFWGLAGLLTLAWVTTPFRPAPATLVAARVGAVVITAVTLAWSYWLDHLRPARTSHLSPVTAAVGQH
jgi:hypothetical protein